MKNSKEKLNSMTLQSLRELARKLQIAKNAKMKKAELIKEIAKKENAIEKMNSEIKASNSKIAELKENENYIGENATPETKAEIGEQIKAEKENLKALRAKKKGTPAKENSKKGENVVIHRGGGVIATIAELLQKSKKGISKAEILAKLTAKFPERKEEHMKATVSVQCPSRINNERFAVERLENGKYKAKS